MRRWRGEAGQGTVEYLAAIVLLVAVVLVVAPNVGGLARSVGGAVESGFCLLRVSGEGCGTDTVAGPPPADGPITLSPTTDAQGGASSEAPGDGVHDVSAAEDPAGDDQGFWSRLFERIRDALRSVTGGAPNPMDDRIRELLEDSEIGRETLALLEELGIEPEYEPGGGSYFVNGQNRIVLDSDRDADSLAATLVHEALHAERAATGEKPDIDGPRDAYVDGMLAEETDAVLLQIQANQQIQGHHPGVPGTVLQDVYEAAYDRAADALGDGASDADRDRAGRDAAEQAIREAFESGDVVASTTGETYPELYGRYWDERHG